MSNLKTILSTHTEHGWAIQPNTEHPSIIDTHEYYVCPLDGAHYYVRTTAWDHLGIKKPKPTT